jgi:hypothetical protein
MANGQLDLSSIPHRCFRSGNIEYKIKEKEDVVEIHLLHAIYYLTDVGKDIWTKIDGKRSIDEICEILMEEYSADKKVLQNEVLDFLEDLLSKNLITIE